MWLATNLAATDLINGWCRGPFPRNCEIASNWVIGPGDNNAAQERYGRKEKHTRLPMPAQPSEATIESLEWVQTLAVKRTRLPPVR